jgi:hypothetical protein
MMKLFRVLALAILLTVTLAAQTLTPQQIVSQIEALLEQLVPSSTSGITPSTIVQVPAGGNLQAAIDAAAPGTTLQLVAGATYTGNFILRNKTAQGAGVVTIQGGIQWLLPGKRVDPSEVGAMATITAPAGSTPIFTAEDGAANYALIGLELAQNPASPGATLVEIGRLDMTLASQTPSNVTFDRLYVHGDPVAGGHRGLELNVINGVVTNSYLSGFWQTGQDSQAVAIFNGPGPLLVQNNYLEASGENFMSGGQDPSIAGLVPSHITFTGNYCVKPLAWQTAHPGGVKNLFELKNAGFVTVTGNVFENVWVDGQAGNAIDFTVRNQSSTAPWSTVHDVTFSNNIVKNAAGFCFDILGHDDSVGYVSVQAVNLVVSNNLCESVTGGVMLAAGPQPSSFTHNTFLGISNTFLSMPAVVNTGLTFSNNVMQGGLYGIAGNGTMAMGMASLNQGAPGAVLLGNVIDGNTQRTVQYPPGNYPLAAGVLPTLLGPQDQYLGTQVGSDGLPLGANISAIVAAIPWAVIP